MAIRKDDYWRSLINGMKSAPLPEDGSEPPEIEKLPARGRRRKPQEDIPANQRRVIVQKIITEVYVMSDTNDRKFASVSKQTTSIVGEMTLEEALKLANNTEG